MAIVEETRSRLYQELEPALDRDEALVEADRCLECGGPAGAPCTLACPAGIDVPGFVGALAEGDAPHAAELIFAENLLGGTCARVCPTELLCEGACVLVHEGRAPIEIGRLQRYASERALAERAKVRVRRPPNGIRIAVIGAGPAGLAAAGELAALGYAVTVYDEREEPGGLVRFAIAPYRQLREPLPAEVELLRALGVRLRLRHPVDPAQLRAIAATSAAVVLAVGLGEDVDPAYPGDHLPGVWNSLPFIQAIKTGWPLEVGRRVVVIGGGNTAIDVAREAVRLGADEVTLVYRRTEAEMPAYPHEVEEARDEGVRFRWLAAPVSFRGDGWLTAVQCVEMRLTEPDERGRARPEPVPGSEFLLPADTAVKAIGQRSRVELGEWVEGLQFERGALVTDAAGRTGNPRFFAAGDLVNGGATVVEAVASGKRVARAVDEALERPR
jgi:dihydropyrimidine dehydrogenase (NAD+) subunit PreT